MNWLSYVMLTGGVLSLSAYVLLYGSVVQYALMAGIEAPKLWQLAALAREARGSWLRWRKGLPTFTLDIPTERLFKLDLATATLRDVLAAHTKLTESMRKHGHAYTESQRDIVRRLCFRVMLVTEARAYREEHERQERRKRERDEYSQKAYSHDRQQRQERQERSQPSATRPGSWRQVLGVPASERDVQVIKKAYRKLASAAHPDRGGSVEVMTKLNKAMAAARSELSFV